EHAVVYGRPAIAVPVREVIATTEVTDITPTTHGDIHIEAPEIKLDIWLHELSSDHPLARIINLTLDEIDPGTFPSLRLRITSTIPISSGLGSGTAVSIAVVRALSTHLGQPLSLQRQSALAFEVEKIHHGTPSGIDNTVVTYDRPIYFVQDKEPEILHCETPFTLVIGDTGRTSPTAFAVSQVRLAWQENTPQYEAAFEAIGQIASQAHKCIVEGRIQELGLLMNQNQTQLEDIGVSSSELGVLIDAARASGANGAKLSGAGLGGNMIAMVDPDDADRVETALREAGAVRTLRTEVST
ncbi:MAG: mevalonate kinase, partial [Anaerolineales bacterium]|nr:mevalonate kinase [Anaerolineales bacterium]